jgi:predicted GIY-YIG superfamily endonuclease
MEERKRRLGGRSRSKLGQEQDALSCGFWMVDNPAAIARVYYEAFRWPEEAIRREKQIKGYARVKKLALIQSLNQHWHDLAENWATDVHRPGPSLRSG